MAKIHVAFRTDAGGPGQRCASNSFTTLKDRIRQIPGSQWTVAHYNIKSDSKTLAQLAEDLLQIPYEQPLEYLRINEAGQVRKIQNGQ
jgi:hypothetical protein